MAWQSYSLDQEAHDLALKYREDKDAAKEAHKMRMTVAYGLERFWGEHLRLEGSSKGDYWQDTWQALHDILALAGINLPNDEVSSNDTEAIEAMAAKIWAFPTNHSKVALAILTQLCDSMVWWTQRYKKRQAD
ncbi:MAG: hypothetical protein WBG70_19555 [Spirulinaceae cyanobacterium]